jgi:GH25 family lysozyme M1 (1,4-beta-N-acetylmuramidase)
MATTATGPTTVQRVIRTARHEVGYTEGRTASGGFNNNTKYADEVPGLEWADFQPWCATFVSWVAMKAKAADLYPRTASCDQAGLWFKGRKRWSTYPAIGAQVFFGSPRDLCHTGIVVGYDEDDIVTIEGNTNDTGSREGGSVLRKQRRRRDDFVVGYGYPQFPEGIHAADPRFVPRKATATAKSSAHDGSSVRLDGVDLSHWQSGGMDFAKAADAGVKFVVHKATEGTSFPDELYPKRRSQAAEAGLVWGGYHFARPGKSSGRKQAQFFLSRAKPEAGNLLPVLDLEKDDGLSPADVAAWAEDFAEEVKLRVGVDPIIYTPFDLPRRLGPLWVARYSDANRAPRIPKPWKRHTIWQFSDGTFGHPKEVPGIGHCDLNTLHPDVELDQLKIR